MRRGGMQPQGMAGQSPYSGEGSTDPQTRCSELASEACCNLRRLRLGDAILGRVKPIEPLQGGAQRQRCEWQGRTSQGPALLPGAVLHWQAALLAAGGLGSLSPGHAPPAPHTCAFSSVR